MFSIYGGMTLLSAYCLKNGLIPNVFEKEQNEMQVYENRFSSFAVMPFPKYISYQEYRTNLDKDGAMEPKALFEQAKDLFSEGKNILQRLINTDSSLRHPSLYNNEYL